jgi:carboxypeptidase T
MPDPYLNVVEVESALDTAVRTYPQFIQKITLPNTTWENRICSAVKIANDSNQGRVGIYFTGGMHAREWVPPDTLVNFIEQLAASFTNNAGITLGSVSFTAAQIKDIVDKLDLFVFPQVNPDGRNYSMTVIDEHQWRKNRAPAQHSSACVSNHQGSGDGIDINRNFDFLWNYPLYFAPVVTDPKKRIIANSTDPCNETYIGPRAASEPETKNVVWIMDNYPQIRFYIDVHSFSDLILYDWGDDHDGIADIDMNFRNPIYNDKRGIARSSGLPGANDYMEYSNKKDQALRIHLSNRIQKVIKQVRGRVYTVEQSFGLYPTAGTSADYAMSRCYVDPNKAKIHAFVIECGGDLPDEGFQPSLDNRQLIINDVTAGLLEFCLSVLEVTF